MKKTSLNINKLVNKSEIMKNAWKQARIWAKELGGKAKEYLKWALEMAWEEAKKAIKLLIPKWFIDKNHNFESTHCKCISHFGLANIKKETEKALLVTLPMITKDKGLKTKFVKAVWIPKAIFAK